MKRSPEQTRRWIASTERKLAAAKRSLAVDSETLDEWTDRWFADRAPRHRGTPRERRGYLRWIAPRLGSLPVASISRADIDAWTEHMEDQVTARRLRATTVWRVWTILRTIFRDACAGRNRAMRIREDNPTMGLRVDRGKCRIATFLFPGEFARLMDCDRVSVHLRRQYALAVYLYPRAGELAALEWDDIDLETGRVHIHRSLGRDGVNTSTKTGATRQFIVERSLMPLLRAMHKVAKGRGRVIPMLGRGYKGRELRVALLRAGCRRADLHASDEQRRPFTFHDLRATGITWMAMRGDSPTDIMERVGHEHLATTERYLRRGRLMATARGERVFPSLPSVLFGRRA